MFLVIGPLASFNGSWLALNSLHCQLLFACFNNWFIIVWYKFPCIISGYSCLVFFSSFRNRSLVFLVVSTCWKFLWIEFPKCNQESKELRGNSYNFSVIF